MAADKGQLEIQGQLLMLIVFMERNTGRRDSGSEKCFCSQTVRVV